MSLEELAFLNIELSEKIAKETLRFLQYFKRMARHTEWYWYELFKSTWRE